MNENDYLKLLDHLSAATRVFQAGQGELQEGDIRVRQLVSLAATEGRRQLADRQRRQVHAEGGANGEGPH